MKVLIFGAHGLLGRHLQEEFSTAGYQVTALGRHQVDVTDTALVRRWIARDWDAVINAAAVCHFDTCEESPEETDRVNLHAPLEMARACEEANIRFCQYSSDYIFDGSQTAPYREEDPPAPQSVYGRQKAAVEQMVPRLCPRSLVLRIAWLYGRGGRTFMSLLPALLCREPVVRVASGKTGRCLYARDAARTTRLLLERGDTGIFNIANEGDTTWDGFAERCLQRLRDLGWHPRCETIERVPYESLGPHGNRRPPYSSLDTTKLAEAVGAPPRSWEDALDAYLAELRPTLAEA